MILHTVAQGETLTEIAENYYREARLFPVIAAANNIADPDVIEVGQVLTIPDLGTARTYEVEEGDTLSEIAQVSYGDSTKWPIIADSNGVEDPTKLQVGQLLWIPDLSPSSTALDNSARHILKGTLVPLDIHGVGLAGDDDSAGGLRKVIAVRQLTLQPGDTEAVRNHIRDNDERHISAATLALMAQSESSVPATLLQPSRTQFARMPASELEEFTRALIDVRSERLDEVGRGGPVAEMGRAIMGLNGALLAQQELARTAPPVGMLNLERIEMAPAGIERGELIATIPLAPGEQTAVTHKEWSVTSKEFTTIVTDSLDQVSETGVTDNTDLSQSTTSQTQHSNQFNITGTVQGGIPIISGSSSTGFTAQDSTSKSATESIKHAHGTTEKASSRSRQEHKTTISTKTETGSSETSTRILKNDSKNPIRIDYFSMMRKWRVRLYRYGLRLTYDVVVPEPGATMRRAYAALEQLRARQGSFSFSLKHSDITTDLVNISGQPDPAGMPKYKWYADQYGTTVRQYPDTPSPVSVNQRTSTNGSWAFLDLEFDVPGGTEISSILVDGQIGLHEDKDTMQFDIIGSQQAPEWHDAHGPGIFPRGVQLMTIGHPEIPYLRGRTGHHKLTAFFAGVANAEVMLTVNLSNLTATIEQWRNDVWDTLYQAAQAKFYAEQQQIAAEIAVIDDRLANVDTLTLRREESDEIMKSVLRFILGTDFEFMPDAVADVFTAAGVDLQHGVGFDGSKLALSDHMWNLLRQHEDAIRFVNQAIEWENVVTFLYSYFWDVPNSWSFIRNLRHPDSTRQAFLRAGSARIVLTVRKGFEEKWIRFAEGGSVDAQVPARYLTIAQEVAAYDDRNYPGIPPANPGRSATHLPDAVYAMSAAAMEASASPITIQVDTSADFVVGRSVVIDTEDDRHVQESVTIVAVPGICQPE